MTAVMINIDKNNNDIFNRYKMDAIQTKSEGRGNGLKTVLININQIAKQINVDASLLIQYIKANIGAQCSTKQERIILTGTHSTQDVQDTIFEFINDFILCKICQNPETSIKKRSNKLKQKCFACGGVSTIKQCKYDNVVLKYCQKYASSNQAQKKIYNKTPTVTEIDKNKKLNLKDCKTDIKYDNNDDDDEEEWSVSMDKEAIEKRQKELCGDVSFTKTKNEKLEIIKNMIDSNESLKSVLTKIREFNVQESAPLLLFDMWLPLNKPWEGIKKHKALHRALMYNNSKGKRNMMLKIDLFIKLNLLSINQTTKLIYSLYEYDALDENDIMNWVVNDNKKILKCGIEHVQSWLKEADSASSDSSCDENNDIIYSSQENGNDYIHQKTTNDDNKVEEEYIDIDAL